MVPILTCETSSKSTSPTSHWPDFLAGSGTNDTTYVQLSIQDDDKPMVPIQAVCSIYSSSPARFHWVLYMYMQGCSQ